MIEQQLSAVETSRDKSTILGAFAIETRIDADFVEPEDAHCRLPDRGAVATGYHIRLFICERQNRNYLGYIYNMTSEQKYRSIHNQFIKATIPNKSTVLSIRRTLVFGLLSVNWKATSSGANRRSLTLLHRRSSPFDVGHS